ncbi:MAG: T9SS type A sorting domain-containing protein [Vicingaceae bacterium]|nr:T9SS type A sorting domain-containing protein [Vicingaceae bacterium]
MKKILTKIALFIVVVLPSIFYAQNPNWQWAKIGGSSGKDAGNDIAVDTQGNIYVLGEYRDANFSIGTFTLVNAGDNDIFLAKYNPSGQVIWVKSINGQASDFAAKLLIDKNNDIYVSGGFLSPTLTIGTTTLTNSGSTNFFVAKYDNNGQVIWVKNSSNSSINGGFAAIDNDLNSYSIVRTPTVVALEKRNVSESLNWSKSITTSGSISSPQLRDIYVNETGVYFTGDFFGDSLTIGTFTLANSNSVNSNDMFVAKLDTSGNVIWLKNGINPSGDFGTAVNVDNNGNLYALGNFASEITFDSFVLNSNGEGDLFLVKYNPSGQVLWAKNAGGIYTDWVNDLVLDQSGGVYIIGETFSPSITFANTTLTVVGNIGNDADVYILKYSVNGNEEWIKGVQAMGSDNGNGIAISNTGEIYVTGAIENTQGATTNIGTTSLTHFGLDDFFLAKLSSTVGFNETSFNNSINFFPNPTNGLINIELNSNKPYFEIEVFSLLGELVYVNKVNSSKLTIDLSQYPKGMYLVKIKQDNHYYHEKISYY